MFPPHIDHQLIAWLEVQFPDKCPDPKDTDREIWMKAGARRVVETLRTHHRRQEKDALNVPT